MTAQMPLDRSRTLRMATVLVGVAVVLGACKHTDDQLVTARLARPTSAPAMRSARLRSTGILVVIVLVLVPP